MSAVDQHIGDSPKKINTKSEIWLKCICEPDFEVSNAGRVRRRVHVKGFPAGRFCALSNHQRGYLTASLRGRPYYVHRLVAEAFIEEIKPGLVVNHKDGVKTNNRLENLEIVTREENQAHAIAMGLVKHHTPNKKSGEIIDLRRSGMSLRKISAATGVAKTTCQHIIERAEVRS